MSTNRPAKRTLDKSTQQRAAAYVRMSTEHQQYSTENQLDVITAFALSRNLEITKVYTDAGKSGLRLEGRDQLKSLLTDVESGLAEFGVILVYDVSRWGRFQDPDESASYEIRCKQAGVRVLYCAEQFENDGSAVSSIIKNVKRTMAGEYSRELSVKVHAGQLRLIQLGVRQGGAAGYGLRRMLVDHTGNHKGILQAGQHKSIQTDRVVLVPGPEDETETVQWIYNAFVEDGLSEAEIAANLNGQGKLTDRGTSWTRGTVHQILINEKYVGDNVWNRTSFKLKLERVHNPPATWARAEGAFSAIVDRLIFNAARQIILARSYRLTNEEMLDALRRLLRQHGRLSGIIIDESNGCPSSSAFASRFGSLIRTYTLIGYDPGRDYRYLEINKKLREAHPKIVSAAIAAIHAVGATAEQDRKSDLLWINKEFSAALVLCRCRSLANGVNRWILRFDNLVRAEITIAVRMSEDACSIRDYYLLPHIDLFSQKLRLGETNENGFDAYRYDDLSMLTYLARRIAL
ncbi:recombinase family protein [Herbaspirillum huttiense]|uniref:recombinase family protein n=1 Tax=Herbaspirillum huttiense TaxID=863372 RepID=UPI003CED3F84